MQDRNGLKQGIILSMNDLLCGIFDTRGGDLTFFFISMFFFRQQLVRIQAVFRGYRGRRLVEKELINRRKEKQNVFYSQMAVKIQKMFVISSFSGLKDERLDLTLVSKYSDGEDTIYENTNSTTTTAKSTFSKSSKRLV